MSGQIIHWRIAKVAKALAEEAYELLASDNKFYANHRSGRAYVAKNWKHFIPFARQALAGILSKDYRHEIALGQITDKGVEEMKNEVYEALLIDGSFKAPPALTDLTPANQIPA